MVTFVTVNEEDDPPDDNFEGEDLETGKNDDKKINSSVFSFCYDKGTSLNADLDLSMSYNPADDLNFYLPSKETYIPAEKTEEELDFLPGIDYNQILIQYLFGDLTETGELEIINDDDEDTCKLEKILKYLIGKNSRLSDSRNYFRTIGYSPIETNSSSK